MASSSSPSSVVASRATQWVRSNGPTMGAITLFGQTFWLGWLMLPALAWSGLPAILLGRAKMPLARGLHNKVLYADAHMNKADWLTAAAAMVGVGFGLWWAHALAAALISLDIAKDGFTNLRHAVNDLVDQTPDDRDPRRHRPPARQAQRARLGRGRRRAPAGAGPGLLRGGLRRPFGHFRPDGQARGRSRRGQGARLEALRPRRSYVRQVGQRGHLELSETLTRSRSGPPDLPRRTRAGWRWASGRPPGYVALEAADDPPLGLSHSLPGADGSRKDVLDELPL